MLDAAIDEPRLQQDTPLESATPINGSSSSPPPAFRSPLNPKSAVRICTFSPCIEQVQRTISTMRQLGLVDIEMVDISHKRIDIRRERVGLDCEGRKVMIAAADVDEAVRGR